MIAAIMLLLSHVEAFANNALMLIWQDKSEQSIYAKPFVGIEYKSIVDDIIKAEREKGFLAANVDSISLKGDTVYAYLYKGSQFKFGKISLDSIPKALLNQIGIYAKDWEDKALQPKKFVRLTEQILTYAENHGYPFAQVGLKNSYWKNDELLYGDLVYEPGNMTIIDTIEIKGNVAVDEKFLFAYLGLKNKQLYNESSLRALSAKINELSFLKESKPWELEFTVLGNKLYLNLEDRKSNQVNALIGLQPTNEETKRFLWTADVQMLLNNTLGYGETFSASYKNLQRKSPQLELYTLVPYILGSKIGAEARFEYYSRDTLFNRTSLDLGLRYQFSEKDYFKLSYQQMANRVPSPDTVFVRINKQLSNNVDLVAKGFAMSYHINRTNYSLNPRKGWSAQASVSVLQRTIKQNQAILSIRDGFDYATLYDTVNNHPTQIRIAARAQYFIPLAKLLSLGFTYEGGYISGANLFQNELYQIGGFKTLRGFDERAIFSNQFHVATVELKAILSQRSYFNLFTDFGKVYSQFNSVNLVRKPISFGTGLTLENKTGIFNVVIALGKFDGDPFEFRNTKVHFGYVSYF